MNSGGFGALGPLRRCYANVRILHIGCKARSRFRGASQAPALHVTSSANGAVEAMRGQALCVRASALMRQKGRVEAGRISGSVVSKPEPAQVRDCRAQRVGTTTVVEIERMVGRTCRASPANVGHGISMTVSDLDIFRAAHRHLDRHGDQAVAKAREIVRTLKECGDNDGADTWLRIIVALETMRQEPSGPHRAPDRG